MTDGSGSGVSVPAGTGVNVGVVVPATPTAGSKVGSGWGGGSPHATISRTSKLKMNFRCVDFRMAKMITRPADL